MLRLTPKLGEKLLIGNNVSVTVVAVQKTSVTLAIDAPGMDVRRDVPHRGKPAVETLDSPAAPPVG